jgi:hypothetical protein
VYISMGEKVPADLRLIEVSMDLQFDRSILTGEVRLYPSCLYYLSLVDFFQSEAVSGRVDMTEENFLEVRAVQSRHLSLLTLHCRPRTSLFRVLTVSMALAWVSSYKLAIEQFCTNAQHYVRFRSDASQRQRSYCKAFVRGNKAVDYFAARALSVCWHYCWYGHYRGYYYRYSLGCMVC